MSNDRPLQISYEQTNPEWASRLVAAMPGIGNLISNAVAEEFSRYARDSVFSGGVLPVQTGETRDSVRFFKIRDGIFGVRPGVGIPGRLNYLYGLARKGYPAMERAYRQFESEGRTKQIATRVYESMQRRVVEA
jgi:hypothetical protein